MVVEGTQQALGSNHVVWGSTKSTLLVAHEAPPSCDQHTETVLFAALESPPSP